MNLIPTAIIATISATFITTMIAAFLTHMLASVRFKNELKIKRHEKLINDSKELATNFEKKLFARIHFTRDYLYKMQEAIYKKESVDEKFREEYRAMIKDWNLNLDYTSSFMLRNNIIPRINLLDELQAKLKIFHSFFYFNASNIEKVSEEEIKEKLKEISSLQVYSYRLMQSINNNIDGKWVELIDNNGNAMSIIKKIKRRVMR